MTNHHVNNGDYLVEVQAQVMTRDDSTQCWVPMEGGGLSTVKLCKLIRARHSPSLAFPDKPDYVILGERLADKSVVLNCMLKKDILYTRANPKFHHWTTDDKRYGLTFERSDDAKAFDQAICRAVSDLSEGTEGDRIFQLVDLPSRKNSSAQSTSTTSTTTSSPSPNSPSSSLPPGSHDPYMFAHPHTNHQHFSHPHANHQQFSHPHANHHHLHRVHYMPAREKAKHNSGRDTDRDKGGGRGSSASEKSKSDSLESWSGVGDDVWVRCDDRASGKSRLDDSGDYRDEPYVIFDKNKSGGPHEYSYPSLEPVHKPPAKRESTSMKKTSVSQSHPPVVPLPQKTKPSKHKSEQCRRLVQRARCQHCQVTFNVEENHRGSCDSAPDDVVKCIECLTCVSCTKCLMYHCMADADGAYRHPCECDYNDESNCRKWTVLTILSFFIPCLWCYMPLFACHKCATVCGLCGGRHKAG